MAGPGCSDCRGGVQPTGSKEQSSRFDSLTRALLAGCDPPPGHLGSGAGLVCSREGEGRSRVRAKARGARRRRPEPQMSGSVAGACAILNTSCGPAAVIRGGVVPSLVPRPPEPGRELTEALDRPSIAAVSAVRDRGADDQAGARAACRRRASLTARANEEVVPEGVDSSGESRTGCGAGLRGPRARGPDRSAQNPSGGPPSTGVSVRAPGS